MGIADKYADFLNFVNSQREEFSKQVLDEREPVLLISHYDADGLTSASLSAILLRKNGVPFHLRIVEQIDEHTLSKMKDLSYKKIIFTDLGSGEYSLIKTQLKGKKVFIIDHHQPEESPRKEDILEVNPYFHGINGSIESSSSTLTYLFLKTIDDEMIKHSPLAIVGALGDRQDVGPRFSLVGLNEIVAKEAEEYGLVRREIGLRLAGSKSRPILKALEYTFDPYIPGLSGKEDSCLMFLKEIGIEPSKNGELRYMKDLSKNEIKKLATALIKHMLDAGVPLKDAERIFGTNYYLQSEHEESFLHDAREYVQILNSCGRMGRYGVAIAICIGVREKVLGEALEIAREYRRTLARVIEKAHERKKIIEGHAIVDLRDVADSRITGAVASILSSIWSDEANVVIVVGRGDLTDKLKISGRLTKRVPEQDTSKNLGLALRDAARDVGGVGGGHLRAGGALIPAEKLDAFIKSFIVRFEGRDFWKLK